MPKQIQDKLDIINEQNIVIETRERTEVHQKGLLHREIHVWFLDKDGNIFFQKRGIEKSSGGLLDATVGGHVDAGENYIDTAVRETKEEIGVSIIDSDLILLRKFRETSYDKKNNTTNNFLRAIYIYIHPISESNIKKELLTVGVDFKKFSCEDLSRLTKEESTQFDQYILTEEIPFLKKYIDTHYF